MSTKVRVGIGIIALALLCAAGYFCGYKLGCNKTVHEAAQRGDTMAWIRQEYHLTPAQFEAIKKLQDAFSVTCKGHCDKIEKATQNRQNLQSREPANMDALLSAEAEIKRLSDECEAALKEHLGHVAALMNPEDGACYLAMMTPRLESFDHSGAPDLRLSAPSQEHTHTHEQRK